MKIKTLWFIAGFTLGMFMGGVATEHDGVFPQYAKILLPLIGMAVTYKILAENEKK